MKSKLVALSLIAALSLSNLAPVVGQSNSPLPAQAKPSETSGANWARYTFPGEEFSVELPEMPFVVETRRSVGRMESEKMRVFGVYSGGVVFIITSFDKPRSHESLDYFATYHSGRRERVTVKGEVSLGGFAGKEYEMKGSFFREVARAFRAKGHAYLVRALATEGNDPVAERFLNSLALSAKPSGEPITEARPAPPVVAQETPAGGIGTGSGVGPGTGSEENLKLARREGEPGERPAEEPFKQAEVVRKALIVYKPAPGFSEQARQNNVTGAVRLRAVLSSDGKVKNISVIKGLPDGLTEMAIRAARHMLFFPAQKDGREVSQYIILEYNFNIY